MALPGVKKLTWREARPQVQKVNPELVNIIDELDVDDTYGLYQVAYPYGSIIVEKGDFYLPDRHGKSAKIDDASLPASLRRDLDYANGQIPAGMLLSRSMQLIVDAPTGIHTWWYYAAGELFALWGELEETRESYHPTDVFTVTAGARSIFMVPNIGDTYQHGFLKRDLGVSSPAPKSLSDHWSVFREVVNSPQLNCDWCTELLLFSRQWIEKIKDYKDSAWDPLRLFLLRFAWKKTSYWRNKMLFDCAFSRAQAIRHLRPNPYIADTVKHLMTIGAGATTGFAVTVDNSSAPVSLIQQVYMDIYRLNKYIPTILCPACFCLTNPERTVYYSLAYPTTMEFSPRSRKLSNTIHEMRELRHIFHVYREEILNGRVGIENTIMGTFVKRAHVGFYHSREDHYDEIELTHHMPAFDPRLLRAPAQAKERQFADKGAFFRGCVQFSLKKADES